MRPGHRMGAIMPQRPPGPHGLLVLDKPAGITSHDLVARTRRALGTRKVGHAGTLDPMATGVMVIGVGDATRLLTYFVGDDKDYLATIRLGATTTTEDAEGDLLARAAAGRAAALSDASIAAAMAELTGEIDQVPSAVSAIKVDGVRSYRRVRDGEEVALPPRRVTISEFALLHDSVGDPAGTTRDLEVRVTCSSGTYVRALARDLGAALGVGAHLSALRRTRVGALTIEQAHDIGDPLLVDELLPPARAAGARFPVLDADAAMAADLRHGKRVPVPDGLAGTTGPIAAIDSDGALIGLVRADGPLTRTLMNLPQREPES